MRKSKICCVVMAALITLPLLSACSGYTEIENMDILTSHFVSKDEKGVSIGGGVAKVRSLSGSMSDTPVRYIAASGSTLSEAKQNLMLSADHRLFYGGMRVIIIGNEYASDGIGEFVDYILSTPDHRTSVSIVTSSSQPREIVEYKAINDFTGGFAAESIIRTLQTQNLMASYALSDVCEARSQGQVGFILPDIQINDEVMSISGYSIFDYDKKISTLGSEYTAPLNYMLSRRASGQYTLYTEDGGYFAATAEMIKKIIDVYEDENGRLNVRAAFEFDITVSPASGKRMTSEDEEFIKGKLTQTIKSEVESLLALSKSARCDFAELYKSYQTKQRQRFYEVDWRQKIADMHIDVNVNCIQIKDDSVR